MRIKRTFAATMREALQIVKEEQGADAVILGNKKVPGGIELISAIDFDQQTFNNSKSEAELNAVSRPVDISVGGRPVGRPTGDPLESAKAKAPSSSMWTDTFEAQTFGGRTEPVLGPVVETQKKQPPLVSTQPDWLTHELSQHSTSASVRSEAAVRPRQSRADNAATATPQNRVKKHNARTVDQTSAQALSQKKASASMVNKQTASRAEKTG